MNAHIGMPWIEQDMPRGCSDRITADDGEGTTICEFPYGLDANSAFIVRACNAHDDLVLNLRAAEAFIEVIAKETGKDFRVLREIRAALAAAGEGA